MRTAHQVDDVPEDRGEQRPTPAPSGDAALFESARRILSGRAAGGSGPQAGPKDPQALATLTGASNPVHRYLGSRTARPAAVAGYGRKLRQSQRLLVAAGMRVPDVEVASDAFPWHCVTPQIAAQFSELVATRYPASAKSRENLISAVRSVIVQCTRTGLLTLEEREAILECLPLRGGPDPKPGSEIAIGELLSLMRGDVRTDRRGLRDTALLEVLTATGMRSCELVDLDVADWDANVAVLTIRHQKGGRPRTVPLTVGAQAALVRWISERGSKPGPLFISLSNAGMGRRMLAGRVNELIAARCAEVGITRRITSHDFRRTMITRLLRSGVDPFQVARCVDHRNVATTMRYDRRTEEEDDAVFRRLELPAAVQVPGEASSGTAVDDRGDA